MRSTPFPACVPCAPPPAADRPRSASSSTGTWTCTRRCSSWMLRSAKWSRRCRRPRSITTNRLTFATFPILGYSLTSDTVPQTQLWEIATYDLKPPLNRVLGVSTVTVQGGQVPEFHVVPNLALLQTARRHQSPIWSMRSRPRTSSTRRVSTKPITSSFSAWSARRCTTPKSCASWW